MKMAPFGDPQRPDVMMGPVVSAKQRERVRPLVPVADLSFRALTDLSRQRAADRVFERDRQRRVDVRALLRTPLGPRLELHFVGPLNGSEAAFESCSDLMGERVFLHGPVSRADAFAAMRQAAALVNLGNRSGYQLPSKVVEYVATGRPVLNLPGAADDVSVEFFAGYPAALQLGHREPDGPETVARVAAFLERGERADEADVERCLAPYRPAAIVGAYERLLECAR